MALPVKHSHFTPPHQLTEPFDVLHRHSAILTAVVDNDRSGDVHVSESDRLTSFETDEEINGGVGLFRCEAPDRAGEANIVGRLTLFLLLLRECHCFRRQVGVRVVGGFDSFRKRTISLDVDLQAP